VTFAVIWVLATTLALVAGPLLDRFALPLRTAFSTAVLVPLLTWLVMPRVTKALSGWLYRR
jgi:antibiotic biosynthesis monooxygenase (ABM) superfamily enzyme